MIKRYLIPALILLIALSCQQVRNPDASINQSGVDSPDSNLRYFDLSGFFENEKDRLNQLRPRVEKTVEVNGEQEEKTLKIESWTTEFSSFTESDINKPAWINSYEINRKNGELSYKALEDQLKTRLLTVNFDTTGAVSSIEIINQSSNILYNSEERLVYYPDSLYQIIKFQDVRIVGRNDYVIRGRFLPGS